MKHTTGRTFTLEMQRIRLQDGTAFEHDLDRDHPVVVHQFAIPDMASARTNIETYLAHPPFSFDVVLVEVKDSPALVNLVDRFVQCLVCSSMCCHRYLFIGLTPMRTSGRAAFFAIAAPVLHRTTLSVTAKFPAEVMRLFSVKPSFSLATASRDEFKVATSVLALAYEISSDCYYRLISTN